MMSKAKWFVVRKPGTGEIIATPANQILPLKFLGGGGAGGRGTKM